MKKNAIKLFVLVSGLLVYSGSMAQMPTNTKCENDIPFCSDTTFVFNATNDGGCIYDPLTLWYNFQTTNILYGFNIASPDGMNNYTIWGPFSSPLGNACEADPANPPIEYTDNNPSTYYNVTGDVGTLSPGFYYLRIEFTECNSSVSFSAPESNFDCQEENGCENCIGSFAPEPGKKYLLSAWVKEDQAPLSTTTYQYPEISVVFYDAVNTPTVLGPYVAAGIIIDGWQRLEQEFTVPVGSVKMDLQLNCTSGDCFFDDVRVFPYDGSMKSYVYDPVNLRLVAELDERNYATIYEYDEEGKLVRIKKETERGIMTIQESKSNTVKQ